MAPSRKKNPAWVKAGKLLVQRRGHLGLTQAGFAARVGVASNTVARWERGEIGMKETTARLIEILCQDTDLTTPREK